MPKGKRSTRPEPPGQQLDASIIRGLSANNRDARLVAVPSTVTLRAIEVVEAPALHGLLRLETLDLEGRTQAVRRKARSEVSVLTQRQKRWRSINSLLLQAASQARDLPEISAYGLRVTRPDVDAIDVPLIVALEVLAALAAHEERQLTSVSIGDLGELPGKLATARQMLNFSARHSKNSTRIRLAVLCRALKAAGWSRPEIANLVVASQTDWELPPVRIAPAFFYDSADLTSRSREVASRAKAKQDKVVQWMKDTLDAGKTSSSRR